jgi:hypothetical protein
LAAQFPSVPAIVGSVNKGTGVQANGIALGGHPRGQDLAIG